MPLNKQIHKVMVIGSGPIVIGQAAEFDYAGTQACRALKEDGLEVVLVNSNPATIMTDNAMADSIYIEPLTLETMRRIIEKEKPDSLLSTLGGQTGLTLSMQLAAEGFLEKHGVKLLGANPETINRAEDRQLFKDAMEKIGQPVIPSEVVTDVVAAEEFANIVGYPVIIRPAFTLGGTGGGIVNDAEQLREVAANGLYLSPIHQILVEKCIAGWKEIEFEVMRDGRGNVITVCSMENFDPVGVHTGDSIVIAPAVTLADKEYQMLRSAALSIIDELKIEGGCNCQFALHPESFEYAVIEVNPRVSRSSALASKATGYPIAKVAAKIAIGYTLDEIKNAVTGKTYACFEPALDYVVVKLPKWPFDKFVYARRELGTQMKATGEVMAIGTSFEQALMKAVRGAEISHDCLRDKSFAAMSDEELQSRLHCCSDERLFAVYEALMRGTGIDVIHEITMIDEWFLGKLSRLCDFEKRLAALTEAFIPEELYLEGKKLGYPDHVMERLSARSVKAHRAAVYKMVDTCAAEFEAETPYFYSTFDGENEAEHFLAKSGERKPTVVVFGSGPIRIGQGIEFDYASVHCVWSLKQAGYEVVIVNNNPETVSTDFDTADRLYFEPLTPEDVLDILAVEKPVGVVVAFGGQTAIRLTHALQKTGVRLLGTSADSIDMAEDRERFDALLEELKIARPKGDTVMSCEEALAVAGRLGYPVLMRPSYVLGGQNMIIAYNEDDIREYMAIILAQNIENPVMIDRYLMGTEIEVDAICDGEDILIPGIMEHIERAGIHSGDSIAVYPAWNIDEDMTERITQCTRALALSLNTIGLVNIQYLIYEGELYVIEVNPRSSRTIPYISKVTGVPMVDLATRAMLGERLADMGFGTGLHKAPPYVAVKVPVFSFEKLMDVDTHLGPEMKSTGEVLGIAGTMEEALYKGLAAAGYRMEKSGGVFLTVRKNDHAEIADTAARFYHLGFKLYATPGTAAALAAHGIPSELVNKIHQSEVNNGLTLIERGAINYVISTSSKGRLPSRDSVRLRRKTVERNIPCLTSIDTANALARCLESRYSVKNTELVNINDMRKEKIATGFAKMQGCGNDFILFDCMSRKIDNPMGLSVRLSDRRFGIGGDGLVLIKPSAQADARMHIYNTDGSEGQICGTSIRCVGKYLFDHGYVTSREVTVETQSGVRRLQLTRRNGEVCIVSVDMGEVSFRPADMPAKLNMPKLVAVPIQIGGEEMRITCISLGNPHCVVFTDRADRVDMERICPMIENASIFPERTNVEFVQILSRDKIRVRTWDRGTGETFSSGDGACAAAVAAIENGYCDKEAEITVKLRGGDLRVRYAKGKVQVTGEVATAFEGKVLL